MSANTKIEWATHTFNPWLGCTKVSPACAGCYAESWAKRAGYPELWQGTRRRTRPENWRQPLKWDRDAAAAGRRDRVFCASLADVFDNEVDPQWRSDLFALIEQTPNLDWLLLTKRIGNVEKLTSGVSSWPNVWLGATICNQEEADRDVPKLLNTPARVRFLSIEPMLGAIDIGDFVPGVRWHNHEQPMLDPISWVIVGGESGPRARPMNPNWVVSIRNQCVDAGVAFLFKQWGEYAPTPVDARIDAMFASTLSDVYTGSVTRVGKKAAGRLLDGREWNEFPEGIAV